LRITILADNRGGGIIFNQFNFLCTQTQTCLAKSNPNAPLWDQARSVAANNTTPRTNFGYYENGQFWRLREVTATWNLPNVVVNRLRSHDAAISFGARNLHVWTKYSGEDPESNYS